MSLSVNIEKYNGLVKILNRADDHTRCPECKDQVLFCDCTGRLAEKILFGLDDWLDEQVQNNEGDTMYQDGIRDGMNRVLRLLRRK